MIKLCTLFGLIPQIRVQTHKKELQTILGLSDKFVPTRDWKLAKKNGFF